MPKKSTLSNDKEFDKVPIVRILVLGDEKVGKSSLISSLVSHHYSENIPSIFHDVQIPAEESNEGVITYIMDSSEDDQKRLQHDIYFADSIVLVYDMDRLETFHRLRVWLAYIQEVINNKKNINRKDIPVVIVGNKDDLCNDTSLLDDIKFNINTLLDEYKFIEACLTSSAKMLLNVQTAFYLAQKAVLYPIQPLYNISKMMLTEKFQRILKRIFRIFDQDHDFYLKDNELQTYQLSCFGISLQTQDTDCIKSLLVSVNEKSSTNPALSSENNTELYYVNKKGITLNGFLYLHELFIKRNRAETCWQVVKAFGYDNNLNICLDEYVNIQYNKNEKTCQLSNSAIQFLSCIFNQYAKVETATSSGDDNKLVLTDKEINEIFSVFPNSDYPFNVIKILKQQNVNEGDNKRDVAQIRLNVWIAEWALIALTNPFKYLEYLFHLGFEGKLQSSIEFVRRKVLKNTKNIKVKTVQGAFFGSPGCGKTSLINSIMGKEFSDDYIPTLSHRYAVKNNNNLNIVMMEFPEGEVNDVITENVGYSDFVVFVIDVTDIQSFEYSKVLLKKLLVENIPIIIVGNKADLIQKELCLWETMILPFTKSMSFYGPILISAKNNSNNNKISPLFHSMVNASLEPEKYIANKQSKNKRKNYKRYKIIWSSLACTSLIISVTGYYIYKNNIKLSKSNILNYLNNNINCIKIFMKEDMVSTIKNISKITYDSIILKKIVK